MLQEQTRYAAANNNLRYWSNRSLERAIAEKVARVQQLQNGPQDMGGGTELQIRFEKEAIQDYIDELETRGVGLSEMQAPPRFGNQQVRSPAQQMTPNMDFMDSYRQNTRMTRTEREAIKRKRIVERRHWKEREKNKGWGRREAKNVLKDMKQRPQEGNRALHKRQLRAYRQVARTGVGCPLTYEGADFGRKTSLDIKRERAVEAQRVHRQAEDAYYQQWEDAFDPNDPSTHVPPPAWI